MFTVNTDVTYLAAPNKVNTERVANSRTFESYDSALAHMADVVSNYNRNMNDGFITALCFEVLKGTEGRPYYFWFQYVDATRSFSTYGEGWTSFDPNTTSYANAHADCGGCTVCMNEHV